MRTHAAPRRRHGWTCGRLGALRRGVEAARVPLAGGQVPPLLPHQAQAAFFLLCTLKAPELGLFRPGSRNGKVLYIEQVVGACVRRLATTGDFFAIAEDHGMAESTLHGRFPLFLRAVRQVYEATTIALPTADEMPDVMAGFEAIAGFPQCCGALDGTHVPWRAQDPKKIT